MTVLYWIIGGLVVNWLFTPSMRMDSIIVLCACLICGVICNESKARKKMIQEKREEDLWL